ncbi:MAG: polyprenyl synthetase family protein [Spirochaetia bacterium]|nr:polyprenyl synthetase family protein [Spirochaetia bacterium]
MPESKFKTIYNKHKNKWEKSLSGILDETTLKQSPAKLKKAILYSLKSKGKRLRPVIFLESAGICGLGEKNALCAAAAIECLHAYSLIHDDLPAMDNDDYRRGRLTNHKVFGEDTAILAGDGLQSLSFELMLLSGLSLGAISYFSKAVGPNGMVGGQVLDCEEQKKNNIQTLRKIHNLKTGRLIQASIVMPFLESKKYKDKISLIEKWALETGELFQIADDILDVSGSLKSIGKTSGKDADQNKLTYVSLYGLEKARKIAYKTAKTLTNEAKTLFSSSELFQALPQYIISRAS